MLNDVLLKRIIDLSDDAFVAVDAAQKIRLFNSGAERLFGYGAGELLGASLDRLLPAGIAGHHRALMTTFGASGCPGRRMGERREVRGRRANGEEFPAEISITAIRDGADTVYAAIVRDATAQHQREDELTMARNLAVAANAAKSEFLSHMSHELRTPLNAVIGFTEIMQRGIFGPVGNARYMGYLDDIRASAHHLLAVVSDVLDMSRIEAGRANLESVPVDVADAVAQSLRMIEVQAQRAGLTLAGDVPEGTPRVIGDARGIKQVLVNLLSNAVKFTKPGGRVDVRARRMSDGGRRVAVVDTGIGIAARDIVRVRRPFEQVYNRYSSARGTGLGLALVDRLMELHEGRLDIESTEGVGTTASIVFPAKRIAAAATG
ncbi:MAG: PAS domain S-box protein [Rhodospirillales bacterium]|nr:PAS domain S-box protein [Rhodospirillales bacterium]